MIDRQPIQGALEGSGGSAQPQAEGGGHPPPPPRPSPFLYVFVLSRYGSLVTSGEGLETEQ